mgnify:CR=1 FL=1
MGSYLMNTIGTDHAFSTMSDHTLITSTKMETTNEKSMFCFKNAIYFNMYNSLVILNGMGNNLLYF